MYGEFMGNTKQIGQKMLYTLLTIMSISFRNLNSGLPKCQRMLLIHRIKSSTFSLCCFAVVQRLPLPHKQLLVTAHCTVREQQIKNTETRLQHNRLFQYPVKLGQRLQLVNKYFGSECKGVKKEIQNAEVCTIKGFSIPINF